MNAPSCPKYLGADSADALQIRLSSRGQLKKSAKVLGGINTHDETLQLFALILADDIVTERGEFYRDFFRS